MKTRLNAQLEALRNELAITEKLAVELHAKFIADYTSNILPSLNKYGIKLEADPTDNTYMDELFTTKEKVYRAHLKINASDLTDIRFNNFSKAVKSKCKNIVCAGIQRK